MNTVNEVVPRFLEEAQQLIREIEVLDAKTKATNETLKQYFTNMPTFSYGYNARTQK